MRKLAQQQTRQNRGAAAENLTRNCCRWEPFRPNSVFRGWPFGRNLHEDGYTCRGARRGYLHGCTRILLEPRWRCEERVMKLRLLTALLLVPLWSPAHARTWERHEHAAWRTLP